MRKIIACIPAALLLAGCAAPNPIPTTTGGVGNRVALERTDDPGKLAYRAPDLDPSRYHAFLIGPAEVYQGKDADFSDIAEDDKQRLAGELTSEFKRALGEKYPIVDKPGPSVVRLHLTLAGINESSPVLSTLLRLTPGGLLGAGYRSATNKPARFTGAVTIAGEATDAATGKLLGSIVAKENPSAINLSSGLTKLRAAELGITRGAEEFRDLVDQMTTGGK